MMNKRFLALSMLMFASGEVNLMASAVPQAQPQRSYSQAASQNLTNAGNSLASGARTAGQAAYNGARTAGANLASGARAAGRAAYNAPGAAARKMGHSDGNILFGENRSISSGLSFADAQASNAGSRLGIANLTGRSRDITNINANAREAIGKRFIGQKNRNNITNNDGSITELITDTDGETIAKTKIKSITNKAGDRMAITTNLEGDIISEIYTPAPTYTNAMGRGIRSAYKMGQEGLSSAYQGAGQLGTYVSEGASSAYKSLADTYNTAKQKVEAVRANNIRRIRDNVNRDNALKPRLQTEDEGIELQDLSDTKPVAQPKMASQTMILSTHEDAANTPLRENDDQF